VAARRPASEVNFVAIGCILLADALEEVAETLEAYDPAGLEPAIALTDWLYAYYETMADDPPEEAIAMPPVEEISSLGHHPVTIMVVADLLDEVSSMMRAHALTPGATSSIIAARGAEALVLRLREAAGPVPRIDE